MSWTEEEIQATVSQIVEKAGSDASFRERAIRDIRSAVKEVSGKEIPADFRINVIDGAGYHANIVLPEAKSSADELSETELESVAGGSKAGATRFFEGVGSIIEDTVRTGVDAAADVAKTIASNTNININK